MTVRTTHLLWASTRFIWTGEQQQQQQYNSRQLTITLHNGSSEDLENLLSSRIGEVPRLEFERGGVIQIFRRNRQRRGTLKHNQTTGDTDYAEGWRRRSSVGVSVRVLNSVEQFSEKKGFSGRFGLGGSSRRRSATSSRRSTAMSAMSNFRRQMTTKDRNLMKDDRGSSAVAIVSTGQKTCVVSCIFQLRGATMSKTDLRGKIGEAKEYRMLAKTQTTFQQSLRNLDDFDSKDGKILAHFVCNKVKKGGWKVENINKIVDDAFKNFVSLRELDNLHPFFKVMVVTVLCGGDGNDIRDNLRSITQKNNAKDGLKLVMMSKKSGQKVGKSFAGFLATAANENGAVKEVSEGTTCTTLQECWN